MRSNFQALKLDGVKTRFTLRLCTSTMSKEEDVPDFYFTLLDASGKTPILVLNQKTEVKERESLVHFKVWVSETPKAVHTRWCCLWIFAQVSEN